MNAHDSAALYLGHIRHRRTNRPTHGFRYRVWHALLDIDRIAEVTATTRVVSHNRFNLLSFYDRDHMGPGSGSIRSKLQRYFLDADETMPSGRILLLTGLRHLGYGFNPVSFYFCHDADGGLESIIAEVNNTFGEASCYLLDGCGARRVVHHISTKNFHVSPFQPIAGEYHFRITRPAEGLTVHIDLVREGERVFDATLSSQRAPFNDSSLFKAMARHAHLSALTMARIHWQALRLWLRGAPFFSKPETPSTAWRTHHG